MYAEARTNSYDSNSCVIARNTVTLFDAGGERKKQRYLIRDKDVTKNMLMMRGWEK